MTTSADIGVLLSPAVAARYGATLSRCAREQGVRLVLHPYDAPLTDPSAIQTAFFSRDLYDGSSLRRPGAASNAFFAVANRLPDLRWLHVCTAGLDLPQYRHALDRGVAVTPSAGVGAVPIAQTVLAAMLAQDRGLVHWQAAQARRQWCPLTGVDRPRDIADLRAIVVGTGAIGAEIGRLLQAVGYRTTGVRRTASPMVGFDDVIALDALDAALGTCDWLILAVPLTDATLQMIDASRIARLPAHARLVNIARGELVDEPALIAALREDRLAGAYLDVFAQEPLPADSPLWQLPGVRVSPHNSAATQGQERRVVDAFLRELEHRLPTLLATSRANFSYQEASP